MPDAALTTNDVRVLRLLLERGPHTANEIGRALRYGLGTESALRRIPSLLSRRLIAPENGPYPGSQHWILDVTGEGARSLRAADRADYGLCA